MAPVITLEVDDMEAALQRVRDRGGEVVGEATKVGEMGYAAYFRDTEGNLMGLWQSAG
ncbi:MAG TPA: VOC family protein [Microthrixaceae bacterium]|mgnify:FL=1|nr:VOC family protein [Microthrixaceae bacterium]